MEIIKNELKIIADIKEGSNEIFESLYKNYFSLVEQLVRKNQGSKEEAKELFQETMIVLFKNVRDNKIDNKAVNIGTYIYAIARNLWLNVLKSKKKDDHIQFLDEIEVGQNVYDEISIDEHLENSHQLEKVKLALEKIKDDCKEIIMDSYYKKLTLTTIASKMGYSEAFVKVKKYRCMEQLKKLVLNT